MKKKNIHINSYFEKKIKAWLSNFRRNPLRIVTSQLPVVGRLAQRPAEGKVQPREIVRPLHICVHGNAPGRERGNSPLVVVEEQFSVVVANRLVGSGGEFPEYELALALVSLPVEFLDHREHLVRRRNL